MIIPRDQRERELLYEDILNRCFASREDRRSLYTVLKNYYLYGNADQQACVDYNKLYAHIDLLASFLFSGETTSFVIEVPEDADGQDSSFEYEKAKKINQKINSAWYDTNLDNMFNDALTLALIYNSSFLKFIPLGNKKFSVHVVEPHMMGVMREDIPLLDDQEAIAHEFYIGESEFLRRIAPFGKEEQDRLLENVQFSEKQNVADTLPLPVQKLIINSVTPNIQGNAPSMTAQTAQYIFSPRIEEKVCMCQELCVWDDAANDYRMAVMVEGKFLLFDHMANIFVPEEHPYIKLTPNPMSTYFWGRTELMPLIPLQEWVNTRTGEIKRLLAKIANPPTGVTGIDGTTEEKIAAFNNPNGILFGSIPQGNIQQFPPNPAVDLYREMQMIEGMFNDVSGIRELMQGKGESGVRAKSHADLLVRVGSSRVKKRAAVLEDAVEKCGHLILKMIRKYDDTQYRTDKGTTFVAKQLTGNAHVKVDSHSSSPIFVEQQLDKAAMALKAGSIDKEDFIDALKIHNSGFIKKKLREREAKQDKLNAVENLVKQMNGKNDQEAVGKLKELFGEKKK